MPLQRWNDELHRRFVQAVEYVGGETNATPKRIWELMNEGGLTKSQVKNHLKMYRITKRKKNMQDASNLRYRLTEEVIWRQTQLHLRQYERLQETVNSIQNQQRQEDEMHKRIIANGESSNKANEVSCESLYQSSRIGPSETGRDEVDNVADNNNMHLSLEITLGLK